MLWLFVVLLVALVAAYFVLSHHAKSRITPYSLSSYSFSSTSKDKTYSILQDAQLYISLVMPAYNEEQRIEKTLVETLEYLERRQKSDSNFTFEIIIVDDGSKDGTREVVNKFIQQYDKSRDVIRLLPLIVNRGKGFAVKQGIIRARGKYCLMIDADAATDINDLIKLEQELKRIEDKNGMGLVAGSRAHLETQEAVRQRAFYRNILMHIFHLLVTVVGGIHTIKDTQCGFKLFTRNAAKVIFLNLKVDRWCFDIEMFRIAQALKIPCGEIAVNWQEIEGSKLTTIGMAQTGRDVFLIRFNHEFGLWKIQSHPTLLP